MLKLGVLIAFLFISTPMGYVYEAPLYYGSFPEDFAWGVATASYQIEGGAFEGGKGPSIWDTFTNGTDNIDDHSDGTVACDSYHKYPEDVQLVKNMNMSYYRFSIAWTRIQPNGQGDANPEGVTYYNNVINELVANGITPVVTLYHWDLPQALQDQEGWENPEIANWFEEYSRICFREFGDRVKQWITLNEPWVTAVNGHETGEHAPGIHGHGVSVYKVAHNQIRAHGRACKVYHEEFAAEQGGVIGITLSVNWAEPENPDDQAHVDAAERDRQFSFGWFAHPILVDGTYPAVMRQLIDEKSEAQGFPESRLPKFTDEEKAQIAGSSDFLGINHYTTNVILPKESPVEDISFFADSNTESYQDSTWYTAASSWLKVAPWGIQELMKWTKNEYGDIPIYITENGFSDYQGNIDDLQRIYYYKHYINNLLQAINLGGVNVKGYFAWSLMDNFEWARGYTEKFGVHFVDFTDPERPRTPKESSKYLARLASLNAFVETETPCK